MQQVMQASKPSPAPHCRVLPPGELNSIMPQP